MKYPTNSFVLAAFMQALKYNKPEISNDFFIKLKTSLENKANLPYVAGICSMLPDLTPLSKYRIDKHFRNYLDTNKIEESEAPQPRRINFKKKHMSHSKKSSSEKSSEKEWFIKLIKTILKKCPESKSEEAILEHGDIYELLELIGSGTVPSEKLIYGPFDRLIELIKEHGTLLDINTDDVIKVALQLLENISFEH
jgi:hypothetical protein